MKTQTMILFSNQVCVLTRFINCKLVYKFPHNFFNFLIVAQLYQLIRFWQLLQVYFFLYPVLFWTFPNSERILISTSPVRSNCITILAMATMNNLTYFDKYGKVWISLWDIVGPLYHRLVWFTSGLVNIDEYRVQGQESTSDCWGCVYVNRTSTQHIGSIFGYEKAIFAIGATFVQN